MVLELEGTDRHQVTEPLKVLYKVWDRVDVVDGEPFPVKFGRFLDPPL